MPLTICQLLADAEQSLAACCPTARLDAEVLLAFVLNRPRSYLHTWPDTVPDPSTATTFQKLIQRRRRGEPLAYLTGEQEFWSLPLRVTPATLIPRPETEILVEAVLALLPRHEPCTVADLGTGCGAIALAIASERLHWQVHATDICPQALAVARDNAQRLGLTRLRFHLGDWLTALPGQLRFTAIVANPPYVPPDDPHLLENGLPFEPQRALVAEAGGFAAIESICRRAGRHLTPQGWLLFEHGFDQGSRCHALLEQCGFVNVRQFQDLSGHVRITGGQHRSL